MNKLIRTVSEAYYYPYQKQWHKNEYSWIHEDDVKYSFEDIHKYLSTDITANDITYFTKLSNIPRYKLEKYYEEKKLPLVKTRLIEKANTVVLKLEDLKGLIKWDTVKRYKVPKDHPLAKNFPVGTTLIDDEYYIVNIMYDIAENLGGYQKSDFEKLKVIKVYIHYRKKEAGDEIANCIELYEKLISKIDSKQPFKIIDDNTFIKDMATTTGNTLDDSAVDSIHSMLSSGEQASIKLAIDFLANTNLADSRLKVVTLMNEFKHIFGNSKYQNVNCKALLQYFENSGWNSGDFGHFIAKQTPINDQEKHAIEQSIKNYLNQTWGNKALIKHIEI